MTSDEPLTIRSEVPSSWANVRVKQGTGAIKGTWFVEGTQTAIYYKRHGLVSFLQKLTTNQTDSLWSSALHRRLSEDPSR